MKLIILIFLAISSQVYSKDTIINVVEVDNPINDRINLQEDISTAGCGLNKEYEVDKINFDTKEYKTCFGGKFNKEIQGTSKRVDLQYATYLHFKSQTKDTITLDLQISNNNRNKNRFDKIYTFNDSKLALKDGAYLNSAVYGELSIDGGFVKYNTKATNGIFVVTNAPMVDNGHENLNGPKSVEFIAKGEDADKKKLIYFQNPEKDLCKTQPIVSYSRDKNKVETAGDYYRACQEKNIVNGVMLTNFIETPKNETGGLDCKVKGDIYFPLKQGESLIFDEGTDKQVKVTTKKLTKNDAQDNKTGSDIRILEIEIGKDSKKIKKHEMTHYHYRYWGDFGVPETTQRTHLKNLASIIAKDKKDKKNAIAHCTGGVGRTGTFLHMVLVNELSITQKDKYKTAKVNLNKVILETRKYRNFLVESDSQVELIKEYYAELKSSKKKSKLK